MQSCGIMFLYDEEIALGLGPFPTRLSGFGKVALGVIAAEGVGCFRHGSGLLPPGCWLLFRRLLCRSFFGGGFSRGSLGRRSLAFGLLEWFLERGHQVHDIRSARPGWSFLWRDRQSVGKGKRVSGRVGIEGGRRIR